jgi:CBS domain-containing protein
VQAEQIEIAGFLATHPPFTELAEEALNELAKQIEVAYFRADSDILKLAEPIHDLYVIRKGTVETYRRTGELYNRLEEGEVFGQISLMMGQRVRFPVKAIEDTLLYCIPYAQFQDYCDRYESFGDFFETGADSPLRKSVSEQQDSNDLTTVKIKELIARDLVTTPVGTSIREAAQIMTTNAVSSLLVLEHASGKLAGILTDWDLRERVLAANISPEQPVDRVMSPVAVTLDENSYVYEASLLMLRHNIHHLPVLRQQHPVGVLALNDLLQYQSQSSHLLVSTIFNLNNVADLENHATQIPGMFVRMVNEDANSHMIGSAMSVIGRSFIQRLVELAESEIGPPPVPYCFLTLGSMARDEQLIYTDQDNAIILDDSYLEANHSTYFEHLARFVCDGLAACGYTYCDGEIMAANPKWRMTRSAWQHHFAQWIDEPNPQALLNGSIFFDLDGVTGVTQWATQLREFIANKASQNRRFLAAMARNALNRTPPLGFFKGLVMEKDGKHNDSINLKRRGTAPMTDVIRVHALAAGSTATNSFERLDEIHQQHILPEGKDADLGDALEYLSMFRIRHQARQIKAGVAADNSLRPKNLTSFDRRNLKEAFQVLSNAQNFLKYRYNANMALK